MLRFCGLLGLLIHLGSSVSVGSRTPMVWTRELVLDEKFTFRFNNENSEKLILEISAPTRGYVAIGFSPNGGMKGSDIVMAWIDEGGKAHIKVETCKIRNAFKIESGFCDELFLMDGVGV